MGWLAGILLKFQSLRHLVVFNWLGLSFTIFSSFNIKHFQFSKEGMVEFNHSMLFYVCIGTYMLVYRELVICRPLRIQGLSEKINKLGYHEFTASYVMYNMLSFL